MDGLTRCVHCTCKTDHVGTTTKGNCSIYADRPPACKEYRCHWLMGHGAEGDRPDRSGMLIDNLKFIENYLQAKPLWSGAQNTMEANEAINNISRSTDTPVGVASYPEAQLIKVIGHGCS